MIRSLDATTDRSRVTALFMAAADYIALEYDSAPTEQIITDFFEERPPNIGPEFAQHFGIFDGDHLAGAAAISFGYPKASDCYIGLMIFDPAYRGQGLGAKALAHATQIAKRHGATRQLIAVLDANPKARTFWEREGFSFERSFPPTADSHTRHRLTRAI